jgi:hypothetical protein
MELRRDPTNGQQAGSDGLPLAYIFRFWLPLALSHVLMSMGMPTINAFVARMAQAKLQLGALGLAFSLAVAIESPVIALLTAAVAVCGDRHSYRLMLGFTLGICAFVTAAILALGLTPLFDWVVVEIIGTPLEMARYVRPALLALTPFPAAVAYRRFLQGVMVRFGQTDAVGYGTALRLLVTALVSGSGMVWGGLAGATVGGIAVGVAIIVEAAYTHRVSRPSVRKVRMILPAKSEDRMTLRKLLRFYWPLAFNSVIWLCSPFLVSSALANGARAIDSLAVWPVVNGQVGIISSFGFSFVDVVVALLKGPGSAQSLRQFALILATGSLVVLLIFAFTPLGPWWLQRAAGLDRELLGLGRSTLRLTVLFPTVAVILSWLRALVAKADVTDALARAGSISVVVLIALLVLGVVGTDFAGCHVAAVALIAARSAEGTWLWRSTAGFRERLTI